MSKKSLFTCEKTQDTYFTVETIPAHCQCNYDYLEVRNGAMVTSPLVGRFCGNRIQPRIVSFSNSLFIRFVSDNSASAKGFEIFWDSAATGCGGELTATSGLDPSSILNFLFAFCNK